MPELTQITPVIEILILWFVFYQLYRSFRNSRGAAILVGLVGIILVGSIMLELVQATVLKYIVTSFIGIGTLLAVVFQPEMRSALARIGNHHVIRRFWNQEDKSDFVSQIIDTIPYLVSKRYGALIAICRSNKLESYVASGVKMDALFSRELLGTIFMPKTLLHDGAVIIENERIISAGSILPVSNRELKDRSMGLRHRAGIGLAEESDAVIIIVSEETGAVSLAVGNMVERNVDMNYLSIRLTELLYTANHAEKNQEIPVR